jgi:hypothetical protein
MHGLRQCRGDEGSATTPSAHRRSFGSSFYAFWLRHGRQTIAQPNNGRGPAPVPHGGRHLGAERCVHLDHHPSTVIGQRHELQEDHRTELLLVTDVGFFRVRGQRAEAPGNPPCASEFAFSGL